MTIRSSDAEAGRFLIGDTVETIQAVTMHADPGTGDPGAELLPSGTRCTIVGGPVRSSNLTWMQVANSHGEGWVADDLLQVFDESGTVYPVGTSVVTSTAGNLREGAGTAHRVLYLLPSGVQMTVQEGPVSVLGYSWYRVETEQYGTGWLASVLFQEA